MSAQALGGRGNHQAGGSSVESGSLNWRIIKWNHFSSI